jgi:hypothetical protein
MQNAKLSKTPLKVSKSQKPTHTKAKGKGKGGAGGGGGKKKAPALALNLGDDSRFFALLGSAPQEQRAKYCPA